MSFAFPPFAKDAKDGAPGAEEPIGHRKSLIPFHVCSKMREGIGRAFSPCLLSGHYQGDAPGWYRAAPLALSCNVQSIS
jgi:hypothetical protein